jgi:hypothetical protein
MRSALGLLAALAAALVLPASAHATERAGSAQPDQATFGVRPATATAPDERPAFSYSATPGARVTDHVAVSNIAENPVTLTVYASDAFNTAEGGFDVLASSKAPVDVGAWTTVETAEVTIPGRSVRIVPFTVTIPQNATPGDHVGGIVAALTTDATTGDGQRVAVEQRVGARVYLRVSGPLQPVLSIEDLAVDYDGTFFGRGQTRVSYTVRNPGNVRLSGAQHVTVETPWGATYQAEGVPAVKELLPGNTMVYTVVVPEVLPAGWLTATVLVEPVAPPNTDPAPAPVDASATAAAVPWLLIAALALLILLAVLVWRRRGRGPRPSDTPAPKLPEAVHA